MHRSSAHPAFLSGTTFNTIHPIHPENALPCPALPSPGTAYLSFRPQGQGKQSPGPPGQEDALLSPYSSIIVPKRLSVALADSCSSGTGFCLPLCLLYPAQGSKRPLNKLINNLNQLDHSNGSSCSQRSASVVL